MRWNRLVDSSQSFSAHTSLFCFTLLLLLKLDHRVSYSWWVVFFPLFLFHVVVARRRFSSPGSSDFHGLYVAPVRVPWLIVFEVLLYIFLEGSFVSLKIVFLPLLAFEVAILVDNFRMCKALLSGHDEILSHASWEALPHFLVAISMVFFVIGTVFTLRKLSGGPSSLAWWNLFLYFGIAECFAFLVCTKWCNPVIYQYSQIHIGSSSSTAIRYLDWNNDTEDITGGYVMKILIIVFQILLCMRLEGQPAAARFIPLPVVFSPIFLVQGLGVLFAASNLVEKIVILLRTEAGIEIRFPYATRARDYSLGFLQRGSRLLGWWSTEEGSREEQARINHNGYNTFSGHSREIVKPLPKKDLTKEGWGLGAAVNEQTEITESSRQNSERLQNDEILCRICFDREINTLLLPCRHHILCSICSEKCKKCPICRVVIEERLAVYGV